jgi:hypothetical protein
MGSTTTKKEIYGMFKSKYSKEILLVLSEDLGPLPIILICG